MTEIRVPTIPGAGTKLSVGRWFKRVGDPVTVHEPLVEIDTDNVTHEIRTPVTGLLSKIKDFREGWGDRRTRHCAGHN